MIAAHGLIATPGRSTACPSVDAAPDPLSALRRHHDLITAGWEEPVWRAADRGGVRRAAGQHWPAGDRARTDDPGANERLILEMGCPGLKVHEDFAAYPEVIAATLDLCEAHDIQLCLHTDGLHESGELEETVAAIGRTMHAYHVEGAGGGHVPDLIRLVREPHVICSSTNPAIPWGPSSATEHLMMTILVHGLSPDLPEHVAMVRERIHPATMAAEGPLHELGGIQIIASDSQGMGRIGETVRKTWQLAHAMKTWRGTEDGTAGRAAPRAGPRLARSPRNRPRMMTTMTGCFATLPSTPSSQRSPTGYRTTLGPWLPAILPMSFWSPESFGVRPALVIKGATSVGPAR